MIGIEIIDPSRLIGMNFGKTIRRGIKSQAEAMRDTELGRVLDRTPYYTGALQADETGTFNKDPDDPEIIHLWAGTEHQLEARSIIDGDPGMRIYADAQEFGSDGNRWNKGGHHMFGAAETEDLDTIAGIGLDGLEVGINDIVTGRGYRL